MEKLKNTLTECFPAVLILGGFLFIGSLIIGAMFIYGSLNGPKLDSESKEYVDKTIPILVSEWNPEELKSRADNGLLPYLKEPQLENLYTMFRKLGHLKSYNGSKGEAKLHLNLPRGVSTTASYVATAEFENGTGTISMLLVKRGDDLKILGFQINSPFF